jgi:anti-sigma B factor antagonist
MLSTDTTPPRTGRPLVVGPPCRPHLVEEPPQLTVAFTTPEIGVLVVRVSGELDLATAPDLDARVRREAAERCLLHLIIDLSGLRFLGLQGIAVFERIRRRAVARHVRVSLVRLSASGARALDFAGVLSSFECCPDVATALAAARTAQ